MVGYFGGLRNIELRSLEFGKVSECGESSFEVDQVGYWFRFERAKQRGVPESSVFCVPRRQADWENTVSSIDRNPVDYDPASVIDSYLKVLQSDLNLSQERLSGAFFKTAHGKKAKVFRNSPMGKNLLSKVGSDFATELVLPNPNSFTGHCWRRSCGTNASDAGVNVTTLMATMGWTTPKTAIGYVRKSRMTSFQMSMFLSNVQRQNKDLDKVLGNPKHVEIKSSDKAKAKSESSKNNYVSKVGEDRADFDSNLSDRLAVHMAACRKAESSSRTREELELDIERADVLSSISESKVVRSRSSRVPVIKHSSSSHTCVAPSDLGSGGGNSNLGGGGGDGEVGIVGRGVGVVSSSSSGELSGIESRVSSMLGSLHHQGALHLHFHFGGQ